MLQMVVGSDCDWISARRQLHNFWIKRPAELQAWDCVCVATRFTQVVEALGTIQENWQHLPSCNAVHAVAAFNKGICEAESVEAVA
jgi:hypothetical protein